MIKLASLTILVLLLSNTALAFWQHPIQIFVHNRTQYSVSVEDLNLKWKEEAPPYFGPNTPNLIIRQNTYAPSDIHIALQGTRRIELPDLRSLVKMKGQFFDDVLVGVYKESDFFSSLVPSFLKKDWGTYVITIY